jgi:hypothetical protein
MTAEEYREKKRNIEMQCNRDKTNLASEYALSNNPHKVGDIFTDHIGSIRIDKIMASTTGFNDMPTCVYQGPELKKDGTPKKITTIRNAWQPNEEK